MANPQQENGHTDLANEIMDVFCWFRVPGEVRQIVDSVIRKTYGWHKIEDQIAHSQLMEMTHLKKGNVSRALSEAITHKLVIKNDNKLRFNKNYDEWLSFKRTVIVSATKVIKKDNNLLSKTMVTKEKKETIQKKISGKQSFPQEHYKLILDKYQQIKKITLIGKEFEIPQHEIKLMFENGRTIEEILLALEVASKKGWPEWTMAAVRKRMAELVKSKPKPKQEFWTPPINPAGIDKFKQLKAEKLGGKFENSS